MRTRIREWKKIAIESKPNTSASDIILFENIHSAVKRALLAIHVHQLRQPEAALVCAVCV